jgi:hypothetical protein
MGESDQYHVWAELPAGDSGDTLDVLKRRLAALLASHVSEGRALLLDPENNLVVYGTERAFPGHEFNRDAVSFHAYRHGGVTRVYAGYTFTPPQETLA